ncbi:MAG: nucleotidyltransferase family protein [Armatimonadetes bacterium]|nr:nucleotidyltransferase family protein [Armatimonadota bacterium]
MKITAIVMASNVTADPALARISPNGLKSLISVNGKTAVSYVVENLKACKHISNVILVADKDSRCDMPEPDLFIESSGSEAQDIMAAVRAAGDASRCLIITGDMPLANAEVITDFLTHAPDCDLVYPIVEKTDVKEVFPQHEAYYVGTKEGRFTGSSSLLFRPEVAIEHEAMITNLLNARKNPSALLGLLGPGMAMKLMFAKPAISDFEAQLSRALGIDCRVFISHYPELVMSIDSTDDIRLMDSHLSLPS